MEMKFEAIVRGDFGNTEVQFETEKEAKAYAQIMMSSARKLHKSVTVEVGPVKKGAKQNA